MTNKVDEQFLCEDGAEHTIGRHAVDVGHGARPTGAQICLTCKKTLTALITQEKTALLERVERELHEIIRTDSQLRTKDFIRISRLQTQALQQIKEEL